MRPYRVLRHRDYRWLWAAQCVSLTGSQMQYAAIDWHIYLLTRSPLALGTVGAVRMAAILSLSLWGGVVADRLDRRKIMAVTQTSMLLGAIALAIGTRLGVENLLWLYVVTALTSAAGSFDNPARQALIPRLVPREELPAAISMNLTIFHAATIGGPAVAGVLIAATAGAGATGLAWIYAINALSFAGVLLSLVVMRTSGKPEGDPTTFERPMRSLRQGLRFVFGTPIMVWTMAVDFVATFFSAATSLLPIFADQVLGVGAVGFGWLRAAPAVGALFGSLLTSVRPLPSRHGRVFLWAVAGYGAATIVFGFSRSFVLSFLALFAGGLADLVSTVVRQTIRQLITPDGMRGRMTSVNMIFFMGGPQLGEMEAGLLAAAFSTAALGATVSVVSGGVATVAFAAWVAYKAPVVREYVAGA